MICTSYISIFRNVTMTRQDQTGLNLILPSHNRVRFPEPIWCASARSVHCRQARITECLRIVNIALKKIRLFTYLKIYVVQINLNGLYSKQHIMISYFQQEIIKIGTRENIFFLKRVIHSPPPNLNEIFFATHIRVMITSKA